MTTDNQQGGTLGLWTCVTMIAGAMIGSAIFSLSGLTIYVAGPGALVSWGLAAVIMLCYGLICAELSTRFPQSGGVFVFPAKALGKTQAVGDLWGWISTWGYFNANIIAIAFAAIYVGTYLSVGFPIFEDKQVPLAIATVAFIFLLNSIQISATGKINKILVGGLVLCLLIYIGVTACSGAWDITLLTPFFSQGNSGSMGFLTMVPTAMVGYGAVVTMAFMVSEVKNPNKNVPRSMLIAMLLVVCLYLGVIGATVGMISAGYLIENPGLAYIPLYAAAFTKLAAYPWMSKVISVAALLALINSSMVLMALTARTVQTTAQQGIFPKALAKNNKAGVPVYASLALAIICGVVACFPQFTSTMVSFAALFAAVTVGINCISLMVARKKFTLPQNAFRAPGGAALPVVALGLIVLCYVPDVVSGGWTLWAYTLGWYAIGLLFFQWRRKKSEKMNPAG